LIRRQDQAWPLHLLDRVGHGEGLARTSDAEQDLVALAGFETPDDVLDRLRLVARRTKFGDKLERLARQRLCRHDGAFGDDGQSLGISHPTYIVRRRRSEKARRCKADMMLPRQGSDAV